MMGVTAEDFVGDDFNGDDVPASWVDAVTGRLDGQYREIWNPWTVVAAAVVLGPLVRERFAARAQPIESVGDVPGTYVEAVNMLLNEVHHNELCMCAEWPKSCASGYRLGHWDVCDYEVRFAAIVLEPLVRERVGAQA